MNAPYNFPLIVAHRTLNLLIERQAMLYTAGTVFFVWQRGDRLIVAFDPSAIKLDRVNDGFAHDLSTRLKGRKVVRTNSRGLFLQVGFQTPPAPMALAAQSLDLTVQPSPWHMPIGITGNGPLWISLIDADSVLIGGSRRMGKSGLTHGIIQALLHGGKTQVYAWDGKGGLEYQAYIGRPNFHFISNAAAGFQSLSDVLRHRQNQLKASGYPNIIKHNEAGEENIQPIALIVDEIALLPDDLKSTLKQMIEYYGAAGLYPILATNNPTQAAVLCKSNLSTRICLPVPSFNDSLTVLNMKGADQLTERGRGLVVWDGKPVEFQTFTVSYPVPTDEQRRQLAEMSAAESLAAGQPVESQEDEQIRELISQGDSDAAIVRKLWNVTSGSKWYKLVQRVKSLRQAENTSSSSNRSHPTGIFDEEEGG